MGERIIRVSIGCVYGGLAQKLLEAKTPTGCYLISSLVGISILSPPMTGISIDAGGLANTLMEQETNYKSLVNIIPCKLTSNDYLACTELYLYAAGRFQ
jgi:hypothetical protein